ncbi:hypothetical protein Vau01_125500 [Virgisporangium aurantiacum]|uniref:Uncharacterized protein n=1 Tax=Virgisporangium aurantiacum TaxID=175570 RepID=A0A8J4E865_9ACTN|nr:hypothetical protein Vau01_125500 [Virgisporangium aurantiacum]
MFVDRDDLIRLLTRDGNVFAACRSAVAAGAAMQVWDEGVPASELARIYARRLRLTRRNGTPEMGFTDAVQALHAYGEERVRIGAVKAADPPYHFQLFLNESATSLIACLGVDQSWTTRG